MIFLGGGTALDSDGRALVHGREQVQKAWVFRSKWDVWDVLYRAVELCNLSGSSSDCPLLKFLGKLLCRSGIYDSGRSDGLGKLSGAELS